VITIHRNARSLAPDPVDTPGIGAIDFPSYVHQKGRPKPGRPLSACGAGDDVAEPVSDRCVRSLTRKGQRSTVGIQPQMK
jgi:hypothetical protein